MRDTLLLRGMRILLQCAVGLVPAFFLVLVTLFSDSGGSGELALAYGLTVLAYLSLAFVASLIWPEERLGNAVWLLLPAVIVALLFVTQEPQIIPVGIVELAVALVGTLVGAVMGAWLRLRTRGALKLLARQVAPDYTYKGRSSYPLALLLALIHPRSAWRNGLENPNGLRSEIPES